MDYTPQPGLAGLMRQQPNATEQNALQIGRVVAVHQETDTIDVELLQGGRVANIPILRDFAGRTNGEAAMPVVTAGYGTASATGYGDTYAVIGYLQGRSLLPVVLGFIGPKDSPLLKRPDGSSIRRDVGGQVALAYTDGAVEFRLPGGSLRFGPGTSIGAIDPDLAPPSASPANVVLNAGAVYFNAPGGFFVNGVPPGGAVLSNAAPLGVAASASAGTSSESSRADHVHPYTYGSTVGQALAASGSAGTSALPARADHVHPFPTAAQVGALPITGGTVTGALTVNSTLTAADRAVIGSSAAPSAGTSLEVHEKTFTSYGSAVQSWHSPGRSELPSELLNTGVQLWRLHNGTAYCGDIRYSTPAGFPGIVFVDTGAASRCDFRYNPNGTFSWWTSTGAGTVTERMRLDNSGNLSVFGGVSVGGPLFSGSNYTAKLQVYDRTNYTSGSVGMTEIVTPSWSSSAAILWNAYAVGQTGSILAAGNIKHSKYDGTNENRAGAIYFAGNGGSIGFYISPAASALSANVAFGSARMSLDANGNMFLAGLIDEEDWIAPTLTNSWANFGSGFQNAGYYKDKQGVVHLRGLVKSGTIPGVIFNLPVGYRPTAQLIFGTVSNNAIGRVDVTAGGAVTAQVGSNVWISLEGMSFRTV